METRGEEREKTRSSRLPSVPSIVRPPWAAPPAEEKKEEVEPEAPVRDVSKRRLLAGTAAGFFAGCACQLCGSQLAKYPSNPAWTYEPIEGTLDKGGPGAWGGTCAFGQMQSPIDLRISKLLQVPPVPENFGDLATNYKRTPNCIVSNTGHGTMQVSFPKGNTANIGGKVYDLVQFHFHTPSEHMFDGTRYPMEAHLVHRQRDSGNLAVLGVMLSRGANGRDGRSNPALRLALDTAPKKPGDKVSNGKTTFDPNQLLPRSLLRQGKLSYVRYAGSLTTPPCSEKVGWYVFTDPLVIADDDVLDFEEYCGGKKGIARNARPVLPLNNRKLVWFNSTA